ncbi:putative CoA-binding protein [Enterococcus sp. PF1-24]|uniref:CoA-binding protein n=1 Tax=unclassified Enterococcus TaxID=2608891 RepID=UPI00247504E3|nr:MULTISPECIES: CoA-binding protein [unclassified Enterococcus]MDH6363154.1 putative CoA-binding protein [Enterococcus sp. PFB1-1]MDH6400248.1 putative CoA-binding protein [Enterococcus sp. PF1-24]
MSFQNPKQEVINQYLREAKIIAIIGLSNKPERISYKIAELLQNQGYRVIPVNPVLAGEEILGEKVYASIKEVPETIDIVDIFRRSEFLAEIAEEFIETDAKVFWAQLGLESEAAAEILAKAGKKDVVMNRCIKVELANLVG